jgi:RNA polymerase sigma-70 factor (ECF subfamily)
VRTTLPTAAERPDAELIRAAAAGDRTAFGALMVRHQASVHRFARALTGSPAAAEDVLQETFLAAWRHAGTYRGESSLRSWLFAIARRQAFHLRRRPAGESSTDESLEQLALAAGFAAEAGPERAVMAAQGRARLAAALEALPPDETEVLLLRDVEEFSGEETAGTLGLTMAAMKSRLHRARLRLAAALREEDADASRA